MSISAIESVLQQMRATALQTGIAPRPAAAEPAAQGGFAAELRRSLEGINTAQTKAYGQAEAFELGRPGVALNDVMVDLQKANVAFQTGLQVRNRLVAAYQEVMSLPA
ncbi:flagellar hook-basal body complex protein FliE [Variovorax guangxiensis]|jgi:flagellar hook-basal body complex protein FliE|uniref:flagellar hook-basal body complex protein FliE n=1 Tax=Variovorax guangxiensis TaxID=1775474 RepID=UPI00285DEA71|nr:flagellar hook-basal body complex protein FliE [Variovorax guangxiensis]MDR6860023.1 flagellar hook-basal body complex protein FliE [Variovorax guangxiensis]